MQKLPNYIKRVLILGHSGFVGTHLLSVFRQKSPDIQIFGVSFPNIDLSKQADAVSLSQYLHKDTAIIMLSGIKPNIRNDIISFEKNVAMVVNICKLLECYAIKNFIYISSAAVYGEDIHNTKITENTKIQIRSYYGLAKFVSEELLLKVLSKKNHSVLTILRPPTLYGSGDLNISYNPTGFLKKALKDEEITLWGLGEEKREFVYIDDMVNIIHHFTLHPYNGVVNIVSGISYSFDDALQIIAKLAGHPLNIVSKKRSKEKVDNIFYNRLFRKLLPDFHFTTLYEGIKKDFETERVKNI